MIKNIILLAFVKKNAFEDFGALNTPSVISPELQKKGKFS